MKAEIIAVGTEILLGQIVNTNAAYISQKLADLGMDMYYQQVVGDNQKRLLEVLEQARQRSDLIILCGGLGPTEDDITKQTVAKFLGEPLIYDEIALKKVLDFFEKSKREMSENNRQQALMIENGQAIQNPLGLACGCFYQTKSTSYLLLPGPPSELKGMMCEQAVPLLKKHFSQDHKLVSRYLRFIGIGESKLDEELKEILKGQTNPTVAPYAKSNEVMLRVTASGDTDEDCHKLLDEMENKINELVGDYFYAYGEETSLEEVVIQQLIKKGQTLSIIEGMTGGEGQKRLAQVSGSEQVFYGGVTVYQAESYQNLLGLSVKELKENGEISLMTAKKMAKAGQTLFKTDYTLALVGNAGPEKKEGQEVGTIILVLMTPAGEKHDEFIISRSPGYIRDGAVKYGLNLLRKTL